MVCVCFVIACVRVIVWVCVVIMCVCLRMVLSDTHTHIYEHVGHDYKHQMLCHYFFSSLGHQKESRYLYILQASVIIITGWSYLHRYQYDNQNNVLKSEKKSFTFWSIWNTHHSFTILQTSRIIDLNNLAYCVLITKQTFNRLELSMASNTWERQGVAILIYSGFPHISWRIRCWKTLNTKLTFWSCSGNAGGEVVTLTWTMCELQITCVLEPQNK